jgi:hypothetical protein
MTGSFGHDEARFDELVEAEVAKNAQQQRTKRKREGVAQSTFDAVLWFLRKYGVTQLNDVWLETRLIEFSDAQVEELFLALTRLNAKSEFAGTVTRGLLGEIAKLRVGDRR